MFGLLALLVGGSFDDEFSIPGASSQVALDQLRMTFPEAAEASATMVVLAPEDATVGDPAVRDAVEVAARRIAGITWVTDVQLPWDETGGGLTTCTAPAGDTSTYPIRQCIRQGGRTATVGPGEESRDARTRPAQDRHP